MHGERTNLERKRRERQHDQVHHQKDGDAVEEPADKEVRLQEFELPSRKAINGGGAKRDGEMQHHAENPCADSALQRARTQQTAGNSSRHPHPNVMNAVIRSNMPATKPPIRIGSRIFGFAAAKVAEVADAVSIDSLLWIPRNLFTRRGTVESRRFGLR
jgi:hypothetical protein